MLISEAQRVIDRKLKELGRTNVTVTLVGDTGVDFVSRVEEDGNPRNGILVRREWLDHPDQLEQFLKNL